MTTVPERMGAEVSVAPDQTPLGEAWAEVVMVDAQGRTIGHGTIPEPPGVNLGVVHFVDLSDGRRLTTEHLGDSVLALPRDAPLDEVLAGAREMVFEDELREVDEELAGEPRWDDMVEVLRSAGVSTDEAQLARLPFVVELTDEVRGTFRG